MTAVAEPQISTLTKREGAEQAKQTMLDLRCAAYEKIDAMDQEQLKAIIAAYELGNHLTPEFLDTHSVNYIRRLAKQIYNCKQYFPNMYTAA